jgi:hypothetical protein
MSNLIIPINTNAQAVADAVAAAFGVPATDSGVQSHIVDYLKQILNNYRRAQAEQSVVALGEDDDL